jgi:gluconolactonase
MRINRAVGLLVAVAFVSAQSGAAESAPAPAVAVASAAARPAIPATAPVLPPYVVADLTTPAGMSALGGQWRNHDVRIIEVPAMPNAPPQWKTTYDLEPRAGAMDFDDSTWPAIEPRSLADQRGGGHIFMTWYRTTLTMPAKLGDVDLAGTKVALDILIDDYAEVWVNGQLPRATGRISPATIQGYNIPNRVMLSESVKPGDKFQIAILGINGPLSVSPTNGVFFREARLEFFK